MQVARKRNSSIAIAAIAATVVGGTGPAAAAAGPQHRPAASGSVNALLAAMTLDEKLSFVHGSTDPNSLGQAGYIPGVPRLGIPPLRLTDGPAGVRVTQPSTAMPAPVALASMFDSEPRRNFETFSDDPLVSANTVAREVAGTQSQGLIATTKHYAENNQEHGGREHGHADPG